MTDHDYVAESMVYRTAGLFDVAIATLDKSAPDYDFQSIKAMEEFAIECSMIKVFGSEPWPWRPKKGCRC